MSDDQRDVEVSDELSGHFCSECNQLTALFFNRTQQRKARPMPDLTDAEFLDRMASLLEEGDKWEYRDCLKLLSLARRGAVGVVKIKWGEPERDGYIQGVSPIVNYYIDNKTNRWCSMMLVTGWRDAESRDAAKAAAEAHFDSLVRSCLEAPETERK